MQSGLETWWMIDLLDYMLVCNYYTMRHDASMDFARWWDFQVTHRIARHRHTMLMMIGVK